ncbi:unnamed protein product [Lactuca virosa]|uniref:Uncharacterized protein n=1 Tax=Lactuca virosa TaxID=75947 RepID=A0AAU9LUD0_9ASTR|nr:unnamed protein product [Lactuca virosa]
MITAHSPPLYHAISSFLFFRQSLLPMSVQPKLKPNDGASSSVGVSVGGRRKCRRLPAFSVLPQYLDSGDCDCVCEFCGAYFWYVERVLKFSTPGHPRYNHCAGVGMLCFLTSVNFVIFGDESVPVGTVDEACGSLSDVGFSGGGLLIQSEMQHGPVNMVAGAQNVNGVAVGGLEGYLGNSRFSY